MDEVSLEVSIAIAIAIAIGLSDVLREEATDCGDGWDSITVCVARMINFLLGEWDWTKSSLVASVLFLREKCVELHTTSVGKGSVVWKYPTVKFFLPLLLGTACIIDSFIFDS